MDRVLQIVGAMNRGGIETFLMNLYRNIDRSKIQFDFLVHTDSESAYDEEIRELGGRIFPIKPRRDGILNNRKSLEEFFKAHNDYKVVHQHLSSLTYIEPLKIAKKYGIPYRVVHGHNIRQGGSSVHRYVHWLNQLFVESYATDFFACSDLSAKWTYPERIYKKNKFKIVNNAIESEKFKFNGKVRKEMRSVFGIAEDAFVVGHVGRFHPQKNHDFLIDIFREIHTKNNNSVLLLVGDGVLRSQIEKKISDIGLTENVIFTGVRKDVETIFQVMDAFVFPSLYEGLGIVLVEAQAAGLKCFTSNKVVPKDVNVTGLVRFLDLNKAPTYWAYEILRNSSYLRGSTTEDIKKYGYDIYYVAQDIQEWYVSKIN
ncbi:glycosyltransferase family 1 protein [Terrihalobacillus insolitus]|uniref:glycosyltransferase family 1 protein n=1 Tax=Terrihalobacillus insolitus TaxID=2950438 RepID=UPI002340A04B|nr:glycosyltransferase family 1 protein [Terrihalobacillus insolitus]MDC3411850.1 glycosyltransferase family 1 protein [Terrihalobacillus insolitus]